MAEAFIIRGVTDGTTVSSFNGRTGEVVPQSGDYTAAQVGAATKSDINAQLNRTTAVNKADTNYTKKMARGISLETSTPTSITNGCIVLVYN